MTTPPLAESIYWLAKAERERIPSLRWPQLLAAATIDDLPVLASSADLVSQMVNARYARGAIPTCCPKAPQRNRSTNPIQQRAGAAGRWRHATSNSPLRHSLQSRRQTRFCRAVSRIGKVCMAPAGGRSLTDRAMQASASPRPG